jgi:integrase
LVSVGATLHLLIDTPLKTISSILGHSTTQITSDPYQQVTEQMKQYAKKGMNEKMREVSVA